MKKKLGVFSILFFCCSNFVWAQDSIPNAELLKEIKALKHIVSQQGKMIAELEAKLVQQESVSKSVQLEDLTMVRKYNNITPPHSIFNADYSYNNA
ncbi:MAG: hypothetical protein ISS26_02900 [Candidatus Omnitrophica bacterium]|nr:hypothetical protein [Candidatus Omnitrophota bacterium]